MQPAEARPLQFDVQESPAQPAGKSMRLTAERVDVIKQTAKAVLGDGARMVLFGTRVDGSKTSGDIDRLFETDA